MDPFAPINGISLERYAEIGAALDGKDQDKAATAAVLQAEGVSQADWDAAKAGWTARMQDMSLMGRVATAFMPLYQAALAKKQGGAVRISYEDFVHGSALIKAYGFEAAMVAANITMNEWTQAAGYWTSQMSANMMQYAGHSGRIEQEEAQLRSGALQPRHVTKTMDQSAAAQQGPSQAQAIAHANQDPIAAAMNSPAMLQQQAANAAIMQNPLGFGLGQAASFLTGGIVAGSRVFVMWSDGNRYPAQVMQAAPDQYLVSFEGNGAQQWVPANAVVKA